MAYSITIKDTSGNVLAGPYEVWNFADAVVQAIAGSANLTNADFQGQDLHGVDFTGAAITGANFYQADIRGCTFGGADISGTNMTNAVDDGVLW